MNYRIDNLQYCNWSRKIFEINREANLDAVHVTRVYNEDIEELHLEMRRWDEVLKQTWDLVLLGENLNDIEKAHSENKNEICFGLQNC